MPESVLFCLQDVLKIFLCWNLRESGLSFYFFTREGKGGRYSNIRMYLGYFLKIKFICTTAWLFTWVVAKMEILLKTRILCYLYLKISTNETCSANVFPKVIPIHLAGCCQTNYACALCWLVGLSVHISQLSVDHKWLNGHSSQEVSLWSAVFVLLEHDSK